VFIDTNRWEIQHWIRVSTLVFSNGGKIRLGIRGATGSGGLGYSGMKVRWEFIAESTHRVVMFYMLGVAAQQGRVWSVMIAVEHNVELSDANADSSDHKSSLYRFNLRVLIEIHRKVEFTCNR
jgi:hypothetical protein